MVNVTIPLLQIVALPVTVKIVITISYAPFINHANGIPATVNVLVVGQGVFGFW